MSEWLLVYEGFDPEQEGQREALCALGNGYFVTRGAAPESVADDVHYPGTYVAGIYNRLSSEISDRLVHNESLVNAPNWLPVTFRAEGGPWFGAPGTEVLAHRIELDMLRGVLTRQSRLRDPDGRTVRITQRRFVSMRDAHLAGLETTVVAEGWSGRLEARSALDGTVRNRGVARYASLPDQHLVPLGTDQENDEVVCLHVETSQSHVRIAEAARTRLFRGGHRLELTPELVEAESYVGLQFAVDVEDGDEVTVEKIVSLYTSRDDAVSEPGEEACRRLTRWASDFDELLERHVVSWRHIWARTHIEIGAESDLAQVLHLNVFHVLQTISNNSAGRDAGVPARGLHGEAYRGHVFWDELFILPFLSVRMPQLTRVLLQYRYRRLDQARWAASQAGYAGAMFPWQSASSGREETQTMHLNPVSGRWLSDASHLQRHVNAAIVYNTWQYYQATGDLDFLRFYGAEMILEIARFWASAANYNHALDRYEIKGVMGPDEYHEGYPDREEPGLDNNAYTNLMAVWCLCRAFDTLGLLPRASAQDLKERLSISERELDHWRDVSRKMRVCFHDDVISQFEGYENLAELDWELYRARYGDISRLDRILESEGLSTNGYKLSKQADVMMLHYLLSSDGLAELLAQLGYDADHGLIERCVEYYERRTAHGSTLSRVVHAWLHARRDPERSWRMLVEAARGDLDDLHDGTTREGIHLGAMAGTLDIVQRAYTGLETRGDTLRLDPVVPVALGSLAFTIRYRGHLVDLEFTTTVVRVRVDIDEGEPITVVIRGEQHQLVPGELLEVDLTAGSG
ncbi:MAG: glycoside hydrolase family 65 protein [Acidimicrobiia bacterium]|nr:glycoside hydrolase family 65 protein [Acidimicrobiia bacterium]